MQPTGTSSAPSLDGRNCLYVLVELSVRKVLYQGTSFYSDHSAPTSEYAVGADLCLLPDSHRELPMERISLFGTPPQLRTTKDDHTHPPDAGWK
jgi:hypothetical protein